VASAGEDHGLYVVRGDVPGLNGELVAEKDILPSPDELFRYLVDPTERDVPEPVVERSGDEWLRLRPLR
jgi:hypothetical protein